MRAAGPGPRRGARAARRDCSPAAQRPAPSPRRGRCRPGRRRRFLSLALTGASACGRASCTALDQWASAAAASPSLVPSAGRSSCARRAPCRAAPLDSITARQRQRVQIRAAPGCRSSRPAPATHGNHHPHGQGNDRRRTDSEPSIQAATASNATMAATTADGPRQVARATKRPRQCLEGLVRAGHEPYPTA